MDFSLIDATMQPVIEAYNSANHYSYYALLTGQDYPIKSPEYIHSYLTKNYPVSFIDMYPCGRGVAWTEKIGTLYFSQRVRRIFRHIVGNEFYFSNKGKITVRMLANVYDRIMTKLKYSPRMLLSKLPYTYSAGSHFWILPDVIIQHLIGVYQNDKQLNELFQHIGAPEESYFQTAISNCSSLILPDVDRYDNQQDNDMDNKALRAIKWYVNGNGTGGHPAIWTIEDINYLLTRKALFGRKFDEKVDKEVLYYLNKSFENNG